MARLKNKYREEIIPLLLKEQNYSNRMEVPRIEKIVLNMGLGESISNIKIIDSAVEELTAISGQKPIITKARKAISNFKLRKDYPIGCKVTLRREIMYEFLDRLINVALPRGRDFRGLSPKGFDGNGNFTIGISDHLIFPEIIYDKVDKIKGLNITIVTSAKTNEEGRLLLKKFNMPFRN